MVDVTTEMIIRQPIEVVVRYSENPDYVPEWYNNIETVEWKTEKPLSVRSKVAFVAHFLGRRLSYTYEIIEWVPGQVGHEDVGRILSDADLLYMDDLWSQQHQNGTSEFGKSEGIFMADFTLCGDDDEKG